MRFHHKLPLSLTSEVPVSITKDQGSIEVELKEKISADSEISTSMVTYRNVFGLDFIRALFNTHNS